jgi:hypothetical protein
MNTEEKKKKRNSFLDLLRGEALAKEAVIRQNSFFGFIALLIVIYISNGYSCMKKLSEIDELKGRLKDVKYENLVILTELTSNSRLSQVEELLEKKGIELKVSNTPAFEIYK